MKMDFPQIEINDLANVIRESIDRQRKDLEPVATPSPAISEQQLPSIPELKLQPDFQPRADDHYHVNELLQYHDQAFLEAAYRAILKRRPGTAELLQHRRSLQSGFFNKIDLLASIKSSPEGRAKGVQVDGLAVPALIRRLGRLPIAGYALNLVVGVLRLPKQIRDQRQFVNYVLAQNQQIANFSNNLSTHVFDNQAALSHQVAELNGSLGRTSEVLEALREEHANLVEVVRTAFERLDTKIVETMAAQESLASSVEMNKQVALTRLESEGARRVELRQLINEQHEWIKGQLEFEIERLVRQMQVIRAELSIQASSIRPIPRSPLPVRESTAKDSHHLDALYAALEDRFRGSREEIKEQFKVYLPYIKQEAVLFDLGCGRGEWLELLNEKNIKAVGIDRNVVQIEQCRARGFEVVEADFVEYLAGLDSDSADVVTGFHIIEHLAIENLVRLLNETMRVLKPGGLVIFETPNPDNVLVGTNFFYLDPTHRHPLPSQLTEFLLRERGFHPIEVLNLHPWETGRVAGEGELAERFNGYFFGPMDYAIVGWKVGA